MQKEEYDDPLDYIQIELLGHCGCGRPQDSLTFIKKILNHLSTRMDIDRDNYGSYEEYSEDLDKWWNIRESYFYNDSGLEYTFYYMLDKYDLINHGGAVSSGWLNAKGKLLLEELNKIDFDSIED